MEKRNFKKIDAAKISVIYSRIDVGVNSKNLCAMAIVSGLIAWVMIPIIIILAYFNVLLFDKESTKYVAVAIFACCGFMLSICAFYLFLRNRKYQAIIKPILANGLLTEGYVTHFESKGYRRNHQSFWHYKLTYVYTDDNGTEYSEKISFATTHNYDFATNRVIPIAFCNGQSVMVELNDKTK